MATQFQTTLLCWLARCLQVARSYVCGLVSGTAYSTFSQPHKLLILLAMCDKTSALMAICLQVARSYVADTLTCRGGWLNCFQH
jgi:hypothetical protein